MVYVLLSWYCLRKQNTFYSLIIKSNTRLVFQGEHFYMKKHLLTCVNFLILENKYGTKNIIIILNEELTVTI